MAKIKSNTERHVTTNRAYATSKIIKDEILYLHVLFKLVVWLLLFMRARLKERAMPVGCNFSIYFLLSFRLS